MRCTSTKSLLAALAVILAACGGTTEQNDQEGASGATGQAEACGGTEEWDALVAAAKEEERVTVFGPPNPEVRDSVPQAFEEEFGISVEFTGGRTSEIAATVRSERQADVHSTDVVLGGADSIGNVLHEEGFLGSIRDVLVDDSLLADSTWLIGQPPFKDPEGEHILALAEYASPRIALNTDLVADGEITGWQDLLQPKWRGKIVIDDPRTAGGGANDIGLFLEDFDEDFVKRLYVDQQPTFLRDERQEIDGLVRGKYAVGVALSNFSVQEAADDGLPVTEIFADDARPAKTAGWSLVALLDPAPHPNAAALFVNWLACPSGNLAFNSAMGYPSTRADVEVPDVPEHIVIDSEKEYFDNYDWTFVTEGKEAARLRMVDLIG